MNDHLRDSGETTYSHKYIKKKLEEHFGSDIITDINRKTSFVTLTISATHILLDFHEQQNNTVNNKTKAENLVKAAEKLIKNGIKLEESITEEYSLIDTEPEMQSNSTLPWALFVLKRSMDS